MSAFRGIITGYGIAAIKNKEAKDNAKMEVVKSAGIDFFENKVPQYEKEMKLYQQDFNAVALEHGEDIANLFGDANAGFYGTGKGLELVNGVIERKGIHKDRLKNFKFSSQEERVSKKESAFQNKSDQIKNLTGIGGAGPKVAEMQLEGFGKDNTMMGTPAQTADQIPIADTSEQVIGEAPKVNADISSLFYDRPEERGVESKYENIKKNVVEAYGYGESYTTIDGRLEFRMTGSKRNEANAHVAIADYYSKKRPGINQIEATTLAKQELDKQVFTPFKIIEFSVEGMKYTPGDGKTGKAILGDINTKIDSLSTTIKKSEDGKKIDTGVSIYDFIADIYNNDLLKDDNGNVDKAVFDKFLENIPVNIMHKGESLKEVYENSHRMQYFNRLD